MEPKIRIKFTDFLIKFVNSHPQFLKRSLKCQLENLTIWLQNRELLNLAQCGLDLQEDKSQEVTYLGCKCCKQRCNFTGDRSCNFLTNWVFFFSELFKELLGHSWPHRARGCRFDFLILVHIKRIRMALACWPEKATSGALWLNHGSLLFIGNLEGTKCRVIFQSAGKKTFLDLIKNLIVHAQAKRFYAYTLSLVL